MAGAGDVTCAALPIAPPARVTSGYGWRNRPSGPDLHTGIDIGAPEGTPVFAVLPGRVALSAASGALNLYGNTVVLEHGPGLYSLSAHLQYRSVGTGELVAAGQQIGAVGRTAGTRANPGELFSSSGPHLHLEFLRAWPPAGRDLDRLRVGEVFRQFGIIAPKAGPLALACSTAPVTGSQSERQNSRSYPQNSQTSPMVAPRAATVGGQGSAVVAALFLALAAYLGSK